jgi:transposase
MTDQLILTHERVDDIPMLIGLMQHLRFPALLNVHLGNHGHHQGLSNGWLGTVWLAFVLSEGDHRKSSVQEWVQRHQQTLERLLGQPIRPTDFTDDRLGNLLRRLSHTDDWNALEAALWHSTLAVYELEIRGVRLDSTTVAGYHSPTEDGVMQLGHSKDHRPDLPQLKLMAAVVEPSGHLLAEDILAGQHADDPLYVPLITRVRHLLGRSGLLYSGDCKMAALATRAEIVRAGDYYLTPLPLTGTTGTEVEAWITRIVDGDQCGTLIRDGERLLGGGYEFTRPQQATIGAQTVTWTERVQVVRAHDLARAAATRLEQRLARAAARICALTPPPGRGKRQIRDEGTLQAAVAAVLAHEQVAGLLHVRWAREERRTTRLSGRGRAGPNRPTRTDLQVRYQITGVERDRGAIARATWRLGWRVQVTNLPEERMSLPQAVRHYRGGWCEERGFHLLKDRPLGIRPLYVRRDDQLVGLTRLLTLAWRLLTLIEIHVRQGLTDAQATLTGLYDGQPNRATDRPTATRLLKAVARTEITLTRVQLDTQSLWHLTPLPSWIVEVLGYLGLSIALYTRLIENSS